MRPTTLADWWPPGGTPRRPMEGLLAERYELLGFHVYYRAHSRNGWVDVDGNYLEVGHE
jgi:hypothetical protein